MGSTQTFGAWLRRRRRAQDLTQQELARRAGCAVVTLQKIEADVRRCSREMAEALARALDVPPNEIAAIVRYARSPHESGTILPAPPHNLPAPVTPLFGRETAVGELCLQLQREGVRLITLCGPPGIGKTRLSLRVAWESLVAFEDGVFFVPLAAVSEPSLVLPTIAQTLELSDLGPRAPADRLLRFLRARHTLLVLDNFEQVLGAVPDVLRLLSGCPLLRILVTSRVALRVRAERRYPVPPLPAPDPSEDLPLASLMGYAAFQLFVDRAQAVCPDFAVTATNAPAVAQICRHLDGLPLAIELIAEQTRLLSPEQIAARLHGSFLQSDGPSDVDERQRTLNRAIEWSYNLLPPEEQELLAQLSVFSGGWTIEAVETICAGEDPLHRLTSLANKSLVTVCTSDGERRFGLLEMVREYAADRLRASGRLAVMQRSHAEYYLSCRAKYPRPLPHSPQMLAELEREHDNLRAALRWWLQQRDARRAARLAVDMATMWSVRGRFLAEGRRWLGEVIGLDESRQLEPVLLAELYDAAGMLAFLQADLDAAEPLLSQAAGHARKSGDPTRIARTLHSLSCVMIERGEYTQADDLLQECLPIARELGDPWQIAMALDNLGEMAQRQGDLAAAAAAYEEAMQLLAREDDQAFLPILQHCAGQVAEQQGDIDAALSFYRTALTLAHKMDDRRMMAATMEGLAGLAGRDGPVEQGARLLGAADALRASIGSPVEEADRSEYERLVALVKAGMDPCVFRAAWLEGRRSPLAVVVSSTLAEMRAEPVDALPARSLTATTNSAAPPKPESCRPSC